MPLPSLLATSTSINKLLVIQNAATGCTQGTNIHLHCETLVLPIREHLQLHSSQFKHNVRHTPYTNAQHTTFFTIPRLKPLSYNSHYTTNIPTDPHTVSTTDRNTNMCHIHTSVVSRHIATRGNNKILHTHPPHIRSSEGILPRLVTPLSNSEQINNPFSNHTYTKPTPIHIHHYYALFVTHNTHRLFNCTHIRTTLSSLDLWTDPAGVTELLARWTTSGKIGLLPLARLKGVGRQQLLFTVNVLYND